MSSWLCDTSIVSELMRRQPDRLVVAWAKKQERFWLSVIVLEEIHAGLEKQNLAKKRQWFERFVHFRCDVVPVSEAIAVHAGKLRGRLLSRGKPRSQADILIAATAWKHDLTVVTRNCPDFEDCGIPVFNPFEGI